MTRCNRALLVAFLVALFPASCWGGQLTLNCDNSVTNATGYRLYKSLDAGKTWAKVIDVPVPIGTRVSFVVQAEDAVLVLYRAAAYNTTAESPNNGRGAWYNSALIPPSTTAGVGAQ